MPVRERVTENKEEIVRERKKGAAQFNVNSEKLKIKIKTEEQETNEHLDKISIKVKLFFKIGVIIVNF